MKEATTGFKKLLLAWGVLCGVAFAGVWSEPVLVGRDVGIYPNIDNQGVCWLTCGRSTYRFDEGTSSWQKVTESDFYGGSACFDKGDTLWVFNGNMDKIFYVRYDGQTWSEVDTLPAFPAGNSPPRITADSTGGIWACWLWWWYDVAYNRYMDGQWDEPKLVPDTVPGQDWEISVTTDALGRVWFGWQTITMTMEVSYECRYNDAGTWSNQMSIRDLDTLYVESLDITPDREGGIWAVWVSGKTAQDPYFVHARYYKDGVWGDIDTIANAGIFNVMKTYPPMPKVAVDAYGRAWVVWRQALVPKDSICDIYYSYNSGRGWSEPKPVDTNPAIDQLQDIAVDGAGRVWCVWSSNRDDSTGVWASYTMSTGVEEQAEAQAGRVELSVEPSIGREFSFSVPNPDRIHKVVIYDACGRVVRSIEINNSGVAFWDGSDCYGCEMSPGVYFAALKGASKARKIVLIQ